MIPFDINKITVEHVRVKSTTTGSGGRVTIVDEELSDDNNEVYKHLPSNWAIVRRFKKQNGGMSKFLNPVLCAIAYYQGHMIAMEMHQLGARANLIETIGGNDIQWKSRIEDNIDFLKNATSDGQKWYCDGFMVYKFMENTSPVDLSADGRFSEVPCLVYTLLEMDSRTFELIQERTSLRYSTGGYGEIIESYSPPIWKSLSTVGSGEFKKNGESKVRHKSGEKQYRFDKLDDFVAVNVDFALKAARDLSEVFGFEAIEPLNLDYLMVNLGTVNLPTVDKSIRSTCDIGIKFTHAMAWLVGMIHWVDTLEAYMAVRGVMKYLTGRGIYRKKAFTQEAVYKAGMARDDIPLMNPEEAMENYQKLQNDMSFSDFLAIHNTRRNRGTGGSNVGGDLGMVNAEMD